MRLSGDGRRYAFETHVLSKSYSRQTSQVSRAHMSRAARPASVTVALALMLASGVVWILIGLLLAAGAHPAMHMPRPWTLLMGGLFIAAGLIALGLVLALSRRSRLGFYAALAFLAVSALAVVFDQVGWVDLVFVALNIIPVILLLRARLWYLGA